MATDRRGNEVDRSLAVRAAWLHYVGGLTQSAVAKKLGVPSVKAHRLIAKAVAEGMVKISIEGDIVECIELENELSERFNLSICEVAPDLGEDGLPLRTLGMAGGSFIRRQLERETHDLVGIGHGRTLAAAVRFMPYVDAKNTRFVSLLGGLTRNYSANPHDVMHQIAEKTRAQAHVMPVPFFANTSEDREVLISQKGVREVFEMAEAATLKIVGIGTVEDDTQLVQSGMIEPEEIRQVVSEGGIGELLGHFFDKDGNHLETTLTSRTLATKLSDIDDTQIVALAGGPEKIAPLRAVLQSGRLSGLLTDERTARILLNKPVQT